MKEIVFYSEKTGEIREIVIRSEHTEASIQTIRDRENHWFVCYSQQFKSSWTDRLSGTIEDVKGIVKGIIVGFDASFGCC